MPATGTSAEPPPVTARQAVSLAPPLGRLPARVHGRDKIIENLCDLLVHPDGRPHIVTGMGGCGKTTVALSVAARAVHAGRTVWWVSADASTLLESMLQIACELGAPAAHLADARAGRRSPVDLLWSHLDRYSGAGWLLVMDGADSLEALATGPGWKAADGAGWVRGGGSGLVLVTSRMRGDSLWGHQTGRHEVSPLLQASGAAILLDLAPEAGSVLSAQRLTTRLGHLPLALVLAGRHLSSPFAAYRSFDAYTTALEQDISILDAQPTPAGLSILQTWEISLDELGRQGHEAVRPLLHLLAHFSPDTPLPVAVIEGVRLASDGPLLDTNKVRRTLQALHDMGLIEVDTDPSPYGVGVTMHPLIAEVSYAHVRAAGSRCPTVTSIDVLTLALRQWDLRDSRHRTLLDLLGSHAGALLRRLTSSRDEDVVSSAVTAGVKLGRFLLAAGRVHEAAELISSVAGLASRLDARHPVRLSCRLSIGKAGSSHRSESGANNPKIRMRPPFPPLTSSLITFLSLVDILSARPSPFLERSVICLRDLVQRDKGIAPMGRVIGIDLGTTYCAMATLNDAGVPEIVPNREGERITPSVVLFQGDITIVGSQAKRSTVSAPEDTVQFVKRHMGEKSIVYTTEAGMDFRPEQISALILKRLKEDAELHLGEPVDRAVITVPAYFDDARRTATRDAGTIAGFEVLRVLNEPTAAAIAYGVRHADAGTFLVYDLGGGTFDVTVMRSTGDELEVLATAGDRNLGGYNWDNQLMEHVDAEIVAKGGASVLNGDEARIAELRDKAEIAKRTLSTSEQCSIVLSVDGAHHHVKVTREDFERMTAHLLDRTESLARQVVEEAGLTWTQIDRTLLVGGSTRMQMVIRLLEGMSGRPAERGVAQDEVVAMGAAILAAAQDTEAPDALAQVTGGAITAVRDVTSQSLGIEALDGDHRLQNSVIIAHNSRIPCGVARKFSTTCVDQRVISLKVTEGNDRELAYVNIIGEAEIRIPVPHLPEGYPVEVRLSYDIDAIIHVQVTDGQTGQHWGEFEIERTANMDGGQLRAASDQMRVHEVI